MRNDAGRHFLDVEENVAVAKIWRDESKALFCEIFFYNTAVHLFFLLLLTTLPALYDYDGVVISVWFETGGSTSVPPGAS